MPSVSTAGSVSELELDPLLELREASATPTPLSGMLQDANILRTLLGHKKSRRGSTSSQRTGSRERSRDTRKTKDGDTESILTLVLAEEERQAHQLKALLRSTGERLEAEIRKADGAEERARVAETRVRDATTRATAAESARHLAELDATRAREEITRYRLVAETCERELHKAESDVKRLERLRNEAEQAAADARDAARKAQQTMREWQAREEGRAEGMRVEIRRRYEEGRGDGYEDGRADGYEAGRQAGLEEGKAEGMHAGRTEGLASGRLAGFDEGRQVGYEEGYDEGYSRGRHEERAKALAGFEKFVQQDLDGDYSTDEDDPQDRRIHDWVESTRNVPEPEFHGSHPPSPKPIRPPSPKPMREPSPNPVPVWLHRQPRLATPPAPAIYAQAPQQAQAFS
ncbi:hypothetical protein EIP86_009139 [Pleurotus ostreatoroseus]|nr:hypothetical protein EIP86_009139 [Pleurotus ostreatoroseus]